MKYFILALCLALVGCVSGGGGKTYSWYNPSTWSAAREARKAEKAELKVEETREKLIKEAQKTAHETSLALEEIPASNAKETAQESNGQTVTLLDQVAGPLTAKELSSIRHQIKLLLSSNEDLRQQGEALRLKSRKTEERLSQELADLQAKLDAANQALPAALEREASLANKWRNAVFALWGLGLVSFAVAGVALYLKVVYGSVFSAVGKGLSGIYAAHPSEAQNIELLLSKHLSPAALKKVLAHSA